MDAAKDVQKSVSNETVLVVVTYFDAAGVELASQSFSSADLNPVRTEGAAQVQLPFSLQKGELTTVSSPFASSFSRIRRRPTDGCNRQTGLLFSEGYLSAPGSACLHRG